MLNNEDKTLLEAAHEAADKAYAPYSQFYVGAALRLDDGSIIIGNNQENAAYPSGLCAERVAIFAAGATKPNNKIVSLAVTAHSKNNPLTNPIPPCGGCRQVISESEYRFKHPIRLILQGQSGPVVVVEKAGDLLPFSFDAGHLLGEH